MFRPFLRYACPRHGGTWLTRFGSGLGFWMGVRALWLGPLEETCQRCDLRLKASRLEFRVIRREGVREWIRRERDDRHRRPQGINHG